MCAITVDSPADTRWSGYSLAERDRRWQHVRELTSEAGLDCIFVPLGNGVDALYLTQMMAAAVVLPTAGGAPIVVNDHGRGNSWIADARAANRSWPGPMADALRDAGMERGRVGVVGLRGGLLNHVRSPTAR